MADIVPFRGVVYDPAKVGDPTRVVAPPYDVVGPAEQAALYARHPNNIIRLELGQDQPADGPSDNRYLRAKQCLGEWLASGALHRDNRPSIYLYTVEYRLKTGQVRTMRGFLSLVTLEEFGTGLIVFGKVSMHGSLKTPTFVRLATEPVAGATTLTLSTAVSGCASTDVACQAKLTEAGVEQRSVPRYCIVGSPSFVASEMASRISRCITIWLAPTGVLISKVGIPVS